MPSSLKELRGLDLASITSPTESFGLSSSEGSVADEGLGARRGVTIEVECDEEFLSEKRKASPNVLTSFIRLWRTQEEQEFNGWAQQALKERRARKQPSS